MFSLIQKSLQVQAKGLFSNSKDTKHYNTGSLFTSSLFTSYNYDDA